jgi:diguanylate cyclase (GGDEF)-like protein
MPHDALDESAVPKGRKRRLAIGFGALIILAMLFAAVAINAKNAADTRRMTQNWYVHSFEVLVAVEAMRAAVNMSMRGERGYLITGDDKFLPPYRNGNRDASAALERIALLTRDNDVQRRQVAELRERIPRLYGVLARTIALRRAGDESGAAAVVRSGDGVREIEGALAVLDAIKREEQRLLTIRSIANEQATLTIEEHYYMLAAFGAILLMVAAAVGISTARAQRRVNEIAAELRRSATTDDLTGLHNRRCVLHLLDIEVARAKRSGKPLSVAVADVDFFKRVNDRHGHAGGDEVLRALARVFETIMRTGDMIGRLGGEEFAFLMPDTDEIQARIVCERLRAAIAGRKIRLASGEEIPITLSTGIAQMSPGDGRDQLMTRADHALYRAKEGGRNQVRLAA